jgi:WD40 repeat protein
MRKLVFTFLVVFCIQNLYCADEQEVVIYPASVKPMRNYPASWSPNGKYFAVANAEKKIAIWNMENAECIVSLDAITSTSLQDPYLTAIKYTPDGEYIYTLLSEWRGSYHGAVKIWETGSYEEVYTFETCYGSGLAWGTSIAYHQNGKTIAIPKLDKTKQPIVNSILNVSLYPIYLSIMKIDTGIEELQIPVDGTYNCDSLTFSPDGKNIAGVFHGQNIKLWSTGNGKLVKEIDGLGRGDIQYTPDGKFFITGMKLWDARTFREVRSLPFYLDYAFTSDGEYIYEFGNRNRGIVYNLYGERVDNYDVTKEVFNSISQLLYYNGKHTATWNYTNGSIKILDLPLEGQELLQGKEILQLVNFNNDEWVAITPDGYYNASPHGDEHLNIRIGNDAFGVNQFSRAFYHPEVVRARLQGITDPEIVNYYGDIRLSTAPPAVMAEIEDEETASKTGIAKLNVRVVDAFKKYPIESVEVIVNGRLIGGNELLSATGKEIIAQATKLVTGGTENTLEFSLPIVLENGKNHVEIVASNAACYGVEALDLGNDAATAQSKPDLWIFAIGINEYTSLPASRDDSGLIDLSSAVGDAKRIIAAFSKQQGKRYNNIYTRIIADGEKILPTRGNILANIDFFRQAKPNDVMIFFVAAHGVTINDVFYFLPSDTPIDSAGLHPEVSQAISIDDIMQIIEVPGRKLVFIDTCQSGGVDNNRLIRTLKDRSTVIFTAAQQEELSQEDAEYGGHFTYSIVEGLNGQISKNNIVTIERLQIYVTETVEQLSRLVPFKRGRVTQHPGIIIPDGYKGFVIAE